MIPQIENAIEDIEEQEDIIMPNKTYKLNFNDETNIGIAGFIDDKEAIKQSIYHILNTERYSLDIYDEDYGVELEQYIGESFEFLEATIEETLEEALTQDERITGVEIKDIEQLETDIVAVSFIVECDLGKIEMEVNVNV